MKLTFEAGDAAGMEQPGARVVVVANLHSSRQGAMDSAVLRGADDLSGALRAHRPQLLIEVANLLADTPKSLEVRLSFATLRHFEPETVVQAVPHLVRVRDLIGEVRAVMRGEYPVARLEEIVATHADLTGLTDALDLCRQTARGPAPGGASVARTRAEVQPAAEASASTDRILEMVRLPGTEDRAVSLVTGLVSGLARGAAKSSAAVPELSRAVELMAERLGRQLDAILHDVAFQRVEAVWRGLKLLVDGLPVRDGARIELVHATRQDLEAVLGAVVLPAGGDDPSRTSPTVVLAPCGLDDSGTDAELVQRLGEIAENAQIPVVVSVDARFLGLASGTSAAGLAYPGSLFEQPRYTKWNAVRRKSCARWVAVTFNRALARAPHDLRPNEDLPYGEAIAGPEDYLWTDSVWVLGHAILQSLGRTGWPSEIVGWKHRIDDLPIHPVTTKAGRTIEIPLKARLSEQLAADLAGCGLVALCARPNSDAAFVPRAPTLFRSEGETTPGKTDLALPYQLMLAQIVQTVDRYRRTCASGQTAAQLREGLQRCLEALLANTGAGAWAEVSVAADPNQGSALVVGIDLRTGRAVLGGKPVELSFSFAADRAG